MDLTEDNGALLRVDGISKSFILGGGLFRRGLLVRALSGVSFDVFAGETLGIVGESGSGKTTLARAILQLLRPETGTVKWMGQDLTRMGGEQLRLIRRDIQIIFQGAKAALNPQLAVGEIVAEPLRVLRPELGRADREERVLDMLAAVGLPPELASRLPAELSEGQAQRVGIARAMITGPQLIVCDEPVSSLDVSVQAQILNLLEEMKARLGLTLVFISHNLSVVRHVADRVLVLYMGQVIEVVAAEALRNGPRHPYTRALLSAELVPDPAMARLVEPEWFDGEAAATPGPVTGCSFHPRCPHATARCKAERPKVEPLPGHGEIACHNWRSIEPD